MKVEAKYREGDTEHQEIFEGPDVGYSVDPKDSLVYVWNTREAIFFPKTALVSLRVILEEGEERPTVEVN